MSKYEILWKALDSDEFNQITPKLLYLRILGLLLSIKEGFKRFYLIGYLPIPRRREYGCLWTR